MEGAIEEDWCIVLGECIKEAVSCCSTACIFGREIGCVRVDVQYHIEGTESLVVLG